jgi:hypothetical protein
MILCERIRSCSNILYDRARILLFDSLPWVYSVLSEYETDLFSFFHLNTLINNIESRASHREKLIFDSMLQNIKNSHTIHCFLLAFGFIIRLIYYYKDIRWLTLNSAFSMILIVFQTIYYRNNHS